jgi:alcohol dehydrogenase class IV
MDMKFNVTGTPKIIFGRGTCNDLSGIIQSIGKRRVLLVTGRSSLEKMSQWDKLRNQFKKAGIDWERYRIPGEPSVTMVDACVMGNNFQKPEVIVAIGGGSVIDGGKAISAMWHVGESVRLYLEGVGDGRRHDGRKIPFIAVPTTAGTGSEATKNAVISEVGEHGFKKSLRHDNFVPEISLIDPDLTLNSPVHITTWSGMDAFTQLLESFLSTNASPLTDSIALSGLTRIARSLEKAVDEPENPEAREDMAYAALCSGITLANAGLGVVHGFASSVGGRYSIPHGLICGTLMGVANEFTLNSLLKENPDQNSVKKYSEVGKLFYGTHGRDEVFYAEFLINKIHDLIERFDLPKLGAYDFRESEIEKIARSTSCKYNPVRHDTGELAGMLLRRL